MYKLGDIITHVNGIEVTTDTKSDIKKVIRDPPSGTHEISFCRKTVTKPRTLSSPFWMAVMAGNVEAVKIQLGPCNKSWFFRLEFGERPPAP